MQQSTNLFDHEGQRIHFVGIGGSSMRGLARLVRGRGFSVSGSDRSASHATDRLIREGVPVTIGHDAKNVEGAGLVVYTAAIPADNPELVRCRQLNIPAIERAELLGQLSRGYDRSIAVCGTHGKTTTTSMLATVLLEAGLDPTVHIGGELDLLGGNVREGGRELFLTEACEYKASFLTLYPTLALVLNVAEDHLDFYRDIHHIEDTFAEFLTHLREGGVAVLCADNERALALRDRVSCRCVTYGLDNDQADYTAHDLQVVGDVYYSFTPVEQGRELEPVHLSVPGRLNALNALGVVACARLLGLSGKRIAQALGEFHGVHRRFEHTGDVDGVQLYHDYGHNPEEYRSVIPLAAALPKGRLFVVSQPHTYSRTKALFSGYLSAFTGADEVLVTDIFAAREKDPGDIHSTQLVEALQRLGVNATYTKDFEGTERYLRAHWRPGDIVLTLGCGNINLLNEQIEQHGDSPRA